MLNVYLTRCGLALLVLIGTISGEALASPAICRVSIRGPGYIPLALQDGKFAYSRKGAIRADSSGLLTLNRALISPSIAISDDTITTEISRTGVVTATIHGSIPILVGQIQVVRFPRQYRLIAIGRNRWREPGGMAAGRAKYGTAGSSGFGHIICR